MSSIWTGRG